MTPPSFSGGSTLRLWPIIVKGRGDQYTVVHRAGRQAITTSKAGVEAIRLLAQGRTVEQAKAVLSQRHGVPATEIDLTPLLDALFSSGFVRSLNGEKVAAGSEPTRHSSWAWLELLVGSPLLDLALRYLPPRLALRLLYRWFARPPAPELEARVAANLRRAPHLYATDGALARIAAANAQAIRKQFCDRLLLASLAPRRLRRWLSTEVRVSGLEHLVRGGASGRGTILCSFHMGSYGLIPFVLGARGVGLTAFAGFGGEPRADVATWLAEQSRRGVSYPVRFVGGGMGVRELLHCLERGETVLLYCDQAPGEDARSPEARGRISVPFLGTRIWSARGVGWLHHRTGAAVLPVVLLWEGRGGHHLRVGPDIASSSHSASNAADAVVAAAYAALERHVRQDAAQWLKWRDFGEMLCATEAGPGARFRRENLLHTPS